MLAGDPAAWADRFRSFDARFLERVTAVWPRCIDKLPKHPDEDTITMNLVDLLTRDPDVLRRFHWIEFQYEPFGHTAEGTAYSRGRIDMAVFMNQDRDIYLAYECKRLNDVRRDGRRSLASGYVKDGLSRFVETLLQPPSPAIGRRHRSSTRSVSGRAETAGGWASGRTGPEEAQTAEGEHQSVERRLARLRLSPTRRVGQHDR